MATSFKLCVDWARKGFWAWEADVSAYNSLDTIFADPLDYDSFRWQMINLGGGSSFGIVKTHAADNERHLPYGLEKFRISTDATGVNAGVRIFRDGTGADITIASGTNYAFVFWIRAITGDFACRAIMAENSGAATIDSLDFTATSSWQRIELFGTASTSTNLELRVIKNNVAASRWFDIAGLMFFDTAVSSNLPQGYNSGADNQRDFFDLVGNPVRGNWQAGMMQPYKTVADDESASFEVHNVTWLNWSAGSILENFNWYRVPVMLLRDNNGTLAAEYVGRLEDINIDPFQYGTRRQTLQCGGILKPLATMDVKIPYQTSQTTAQLIEDILDQWNPNHPRNLDTGVVTCPVFGDNLSLDNDPSKNMKASQAIANLVETERGRLYTEKTGVIRFRNQNWFTGLAYVGNDDIDDDFVSVSYANMGNAYVNVVEATYYPRLTTGGHTLHNLHSNIVIPAGEVRTVRMNYTNSDGKPVGASSASATTVTFSGATPSVTFTSFGQYAEVEFDNSANGSAATCTAYTITGTKSESPDPEVVVIEDRYTALPDIGRRVLKLDLRGITTYASAFTIAELEYDRRQVNNQRLESVTTVAGTDGTDDTAVYNRNILEVIKVTEYYNDLVIYYIVVGVKHQIDANAQTITSTWILEPYV